VEIVETASCGRYDGPSFVPIGAGFSSKSNPGRSSNRQNSAIGLANLTLVKKLCILGNRMLFCITYLPALLSSSQNTWINRTVENGE